MSITNTPGTYSVSVIAAELGGINGDQSKPALRLTYQHETGTIDQLLRLYAGAKPIALETLREGLGYTFTAEPESLIGTKCRIKTENKWDEKEQKNFYNVKGPYAIGVQLTPPPRNLLTQLAAEAKALPPSAPRPPRPAAPRPSAPAPKNDFASDESEPF